METTENLSNYLDQYLNVKAFKDYAPNGLQVQGKKEIHKLVTGVTASLALIDRAIELEADAVLVHHGYFWKGENQCITGMKYQRIAKLIKSDMNLFGYHLPLDAHPEIGNNAQLAKKLGITPQLALDEQGVGNVGMLDAPLSLERLGKRISQELQREPIVVSAGDHEVQKVAYCTGGAQRYISQAIAMGADAYITGEISENTVHEARECGVHFISAGHHATERYGALALGEHLAARFKLEHTFVDIPNPA